MIDSPYQIVLKVHFTFKKYLLQNPGLIYSPHAIIAQFCLTYDHCQPTRSISELPYDLLPSTAVRVILFLQYPTDYVVTDFPVVVTENVKGLALNLHNIYD